MNRDEQLAVIRQKCIEANSDKNWNEERQDGFGYWKAYPLPIRLADVLLAVGKKKKAVCVDSGGYIGVAQPPPFPDQGVVFVFCDFKYDLHKDDLTEQSDECLTFLAQLLN